MASKHPDRLTKAQLSQKKTRALIYFFILLLSNAALLVWVIVLFLAGKEIPLILVIPAFFILFMLTVAANMMRLATENELRKREK